jgi:hypothetical protein
MIINQLKKGFKMQNKEQEISKKAYYKYLQRGAEHGRDIEDWLEAEKEILKVSKKSSSKKETRKPTTTRRTSKKK